MSREAKVGSTNRADKAPTAAVTGLTQLLTPVISEAGYDLEELVVTPMGRRSQLRVVIDRDAGVNLDDISAMSHAVSAVLDADDAAMGKSPYVLEVTSPGVDRPLTEPRHWRRAAGRLIRATRSVDGGEEIVEGRIVAVDGETVKLIVRADRTEQEVELPLSELGAGKVQLEFNRPSDSPGSKKTRTEKGRDR